MSLYEVTTNYIFMSTSQKKMAVQYLFQIPPLLFIFKAAYLIFAPQQQNESLHKDKMRVAVHCTLISKQQIYHIYTPLIVLQLAWVMFFMFVVQRSCIVMFLACQILALVS